MRGVFILGTIIEHQNRMEEKEKPCLQSIPPENLVACLMAENDKLQAI